MAHDTLAELVGVDAGDGVARFADVRLRVSRAAWQFATERADEIDAHWGVRRAQSPSMFNGVIHLLHAGRYAAGVLEGDLLRTDFKSYLLWRDTGFPASGVRDAFGSALIRSREGHVVLGRQRAGNINSGFAYLPGGFIDEKDVRADGTIDIAGSVLRELGEETGLSLADVRVAPGFIVTRCGPLLSLARELVSPLTADELRARILDYIAMDAGSELVDAVIVRDAADVASANVHDYARLLLGELFAGRV